MELNKIIEQVQSDIFDSLQEVDLKLLANLSCIGSGVFSLKLVDVNHIDEFLKDLAYRDYYDLVELNIDKIKALKTPENDMLIKGFFLIDNGYLFITLMINLGNYFFTFAHIMHTLKLKFDSGYRDNCQQGNDECKKCIYLNKRNRYHSF